MTKKEHLLAVRPNIESDVFSNVLNDVLQAMENYSNEQLNLSGVGDIVHRAELKVLENVSDYIPCEIYSQAVILSKKKRDNVR